MKITIAFLFTLTSLMVYGQNTATSTITPNKQDRFMCQHIELTPDNKKVFLKDNVKIETENLFLEADSAVFDYDSQELVAYGMKQFIFNGGETVINDKTHKDIVRYRLRDKIIYIE